MDLRNRLRTFLREELSPGGVDITFSDHDSLMEQGILDSVGVLELVSYLEQAFGIEIDDTELVPANLDSVDALVTFVEHKRAKPLDSDKG